MATISFNKPKGVPLEDLKTGDFFCYDAHVDVLFLVIGRNNQRQMRCINMNANKEWEIEVKTIVHIVPHHIISIKVG